MASGQTLDDFVPGDADYVSSFPVAFGPDQNGLNCYQFGPSAEGWILFDGFLGQQYGGSGITFKLAWCCQVNSGVVKFGISLQRLNAGLVLTGSLAWGAEVSQTVTVPGTAYQMAYTTFTFSSANIPMQPGEIYRIRIRRDITPGTNAAGIAEVLRLLAVEA